MNILFTIAFIPLAFLVGIGIIILISLVFGSLYAAFFGSIGWLIATSQKTILAKHTPEHPLEEN